MPDYTILIIDYEPRSIDRMRVPLERAGYKVEIALDGLKGIESFEALHPDLTVVEAMIPKKHGFEVCKELKQTEHGQRSPIFIVSAIYRGRKHENDARHRCHCDEFLSKPISDEDLVAAVGNHLQGRPATVVAAPAEADAPEMIDPVLSRVEDEIVNRIDSILSD